MEQRPFTAQKDGTVFEFIGLIAAGAASIGGYLQSRYFVRRRLTYLDMIHKPGAAIVAGAGAAVVAMPIVWLLPLVGTGTAILFGAGVGTGVAAGARDVRKRISSRF